jgi:hypothetical protein
MIPRPRLALSFSILAHLDIVREVAGADMVGQSRVMEIPCTLGLLV